MALSKEERRNNRKHVLEALKNQTGSSGGDVAAPRVQAYINDPVGATTVEFGYVGGLTLRRFYVAADQPDDNRRAALWEDLVGRMGKPDAKDPGGWDGKSDVKMLQAIAEEA